jgi:hypothetical protein
MMRTLERDVAKFIPVEIYMFYPNLGNIYRGTTRNGIAWTMLRANTGVYVFSFEPGLIVVTAVATASGGVIASAAIGSTNTVQVDCVTHAGATYDTQHQLFATLVDKRV